MGELTVEALAKIIDDADRAFGFSMELTRLVGGVRTYTLSFSDAVGEPATEWEFTGDLYDRVGEVRSRFRAERILAFLSTQDSANGLAGDLIQAREARDRLVQALGIAMGALQTIQGMEPVTHEITLPVVMANHATDALNDIKALAALAQPAEDGR
jgi:hypothetical protein